MDRQLDNVGPADRHVTIAGRDLTISPYTITDIMQARQRARPLLDGLYGLVLTGTLPDYEEVMTLLAAHIELAIDLVAASAHIERDWIESLNAIDGELLLSCWWGTVGPALMQMALRRLMVQQQTMAGMTGAAIHG